MRSLHKGKSIFIALSAVALIFSLSLPAFAWQWPSTFTISTTGTATATYAQTVSWASFLEEQTKMKVRVIPADNYVERARAHKAGQSILSANTPTEVFTQVEASAMHATREGGPYDVQIVWANVRVPFGFIVAKDSDIKTIYDLKKRKPKIALFTPSTASVLHVKALLAMIQLDEKDVTFVPVTTWGNSTKSVPEGKADVAFTSPTSAVTQEAEASAKGIRWLELPKDDKEGLERYAKVMRGISFATNNRGVKSAHGVHMAANVNQYYVRGNEDPELIYQLAKWFDENFEKYKDRHPDNVYMSLDIQRENFTLVRQNNYLPVHDGMVRYLKEKGKWTTADTAWNDKNKELVARYVKAYHAAIAAADAKKIKVFPDNKEWVALWESYKKELPLFGLPQK
ncbi:MAG TPA: TAXI family TRAP transporter solute-binding subunit [Syntrophorhabdaceae bacterium]|nr:TAXI family TRAP transporter solute-binding subunit [Syntrophorhabdaceae bacterium]